MLLLALTNQMCQDVAVVPFLWVLPLSLYLLTFVIAFDHARWYYRPITIPLAVLAIGGVVKLMLSSFSEEEMHISRQIAIYCSAIFFGALVCHGEAARIKPASRFLTKFYLSISLGGAIGGLFVSLAAPQLFTGYGELHLAFCLFAGLITLQMYRRFKSAKRFTWHYLVGVGWLALVVLLALSLSLHIGTRKDGEIDASRGFYGVLQVYEFGVGTEDHFRELYHGRIAHGRQYMREDLQTLATSYFSWESAVGGIFTCHPSADQKNPKPMHVGVIGLGIGTISAYAREGDRYRFYEINPQVEEMARKHFTFLADCKGEESIIIGDGRVSLEWELAAGDAQDFDVLFVDAFSGDSIPIHLLTKEAFELYFQHLKPEGVLAIHITNLHLDLSDPVRNLAEDFGYEAVRVEGYPEIGTRNIYYSNWILISQNETFLQRLELNQYPTEWDREIPKEIHWTDDYSNMLEVIMEE
jgi:spermidine synthase